MKIFQVIFACNKVFIIFHTDVSLTIYENILTTNKNLRLSIFLSVDLVLRECMN